MFIESVSENYLQSTISKRKQNIALTLQDLNIKFQGIQRLGFDDDRNLAAIGNKMHEEECVFKTNS